MTNSNDNRFGITLSVLGIALFVLVWHIVCTSIFQDERHPPPLVVAKSVGDYYQSGEMTRDIWASLSNGLAGFSIAALLGVFVGLLTGRIWWLRRLIAPLLHYVRALPPVAILPLFILWFSGITDESKIITISFGTFFPIWLNTTHGAGRVPEIYLRNASLLTTSKLKILTTVVLPATIPYIIVGLRGGIATAFIMIYVSELGGANQGIGYTIANAQGSLKTELVIAALLLLAALAMIVDWTLKGIVRMAFPWNTKI